MWGIGTGWSTSLPNYHPRDIIANLQRQWRSLTFSCHWVAWSIPLLSPDLTCRYIRCEPLQEPCKAFQGTGRPWINGDQTNTHTQTPSQALGCCRRCAHGMLVSKGASCCFLLSLCFDTSNKSMKLVSNTDRPWDSLSDFAETSSLQAEWKLDSCSLSGVMPSRLPYSRSWGRQKKLATNLWELLKSLELKRDRGVERERENT